MQFSSDDYWKYYLKKLEMLNEKKANNSKYIYDVGFDKVSKDKNLELYDLYMDKLANSIYRKRINNPYETIKNGRDKFAHLDIFEQTKVLLNIQLVFSRMAGGCDLSVIGGKSHSAATVSFSASLSNWKKYYSDVRLIDQSPSGLWEKQSGNLLELL